MLRQIILKILFAIVVALSFTNSVSAQLKSMDSSNQILVDLSVIGIQITEPSFKQTTRINGKRSYLEEPPTEMPRSTFTPSTTKTSRKLARIKFEPKFESSKKLYKRRKSSKKGC